MADHGRWWVVALVIGVVVPLAGAAVPADQVVARPTEMRLAPQRDRPVVAAPLDDGELVPPLEDPEVVPPDDDPPTEPTGLLARDDTAAATIGVPVTIRYADNDVYPESVTAAVTVPAQHGTVAAGQPGELLYTADDTVADADAFVYEVCTAGGLCDEATVTIEIVTDAAMVPETDDGVVAESSGPTASGVCQAPLQWGGHGNGRIPQNAMRSIGAGQSLMAEAASAFVAMREAAATQGVTIGVTDSYRSFDAQVAVRAAKGHLVATATPGTSVHGWGKALDLKVRDPQVREWLERHSRAYAWINPPWAKRPGKSFEPWHYEYYGVGVNTDPRCAGIGSALAGGALAGGASEAAASVSTLTPVSSSLSVGSMGLGLGALLSLAAAALLVVRDLQRTRQVRGGPPS